MSHQASRRVSLPAALAHLTLTSIACMLLVGCASVVGASYVKPVDVPDDSKAQAQEQCDAAAQKQKDKTAKDCLKKSDSK